VRDGSDERATHLSSPRTLESVRDSEVAKLGLENATDRFRIC
jgi:hypothetical protein